MNETITPEIVATLERLAAAGIDLLPMPELTSHYVVARGGFVAMVERRENGSFGSSGNPGKIGRHGFALFVRKGDHAMFVSKGHEEPADAEEVGSVTAFAADLKAALGG